MLPLLYLLAASSIDSAVADVIATAKALAQTGAKLQHLAPASDFWRSRVIDAQGVRFYTPASLPLRLKHLEALGTWKLVHRSKTSSVAFTHCIKPKHCASIYAELLHPPGPNNPQVTSIRVTRLSE